MTVGVVVIGRNEGERLRRCLESVVRQAPAVVYVDSGSTDGSVTLARSLGVDTVDLDMSTPFTAARARNAGFAALTAHWPDIAFVQFVDGDCELMGDWLLKARAALGQRRELAAIAGRIRERRPEASIYNRLGEMEWNFQGVGDVGSVGGIFMIRRSAFESVNGFDPSVPAGEEPELCQRLARAGWVINRSDLDMAWHDLAMTRFGQWWQRQIRGGYGGLDVARRFGLSRFARHVMRARFWSAWPFLVVLAWFGAEALSGRDATWFVASVFFALWPAQAGRIAIRAWRQGQPFSIATAYALLTMISFWPQMIGQLQYLFDKARKHGVRLIEYKSVATCHETGPVREGSIHGRP